MAGQGPNMDQFEAYFQKADVDRDGRVSGNEAVAFFKGSSLPQQVLAKIWTFADRNRTGFLGRTEFYNALKLVTVAQSKRELTPELVQAALYGPASAKIPAPQINLAAIAGPQTNNVGAPSAQFSSSSTSTQGIGAGGAHGFPSQQGQLTRPPRPPPPSSGFQSHVGIPSQGMPSAGSMSTPHRPTSPNSFGGLTDVSQVGSASQVLNRSLSPSTTQGGVGLIASSTEQPRSIESTGVPQPSSSRPSDAASISSQDTKDSKPNSFPGNGSAPDSVFGDVFSVTSSQPKQTPPSFASANTSSAVPVHSAGAQPTVRPNSFSHQPLPIQPQPLQPGVKANQLVSAKTSSGVPVQAEHSVSGQSLPPWPRMTQADVQKYQKVFLQVDTDKDGKITGVEARNLFLSWRLPREVLKQVWDLSDQDNDSMLSMREFCIALYLMERYREGRVLPSVLPDGIMFDETLLPASVQPAGAQKTAAWAHIPGVQQPQWPRVPRPVHSGAGGRPPRPVPIPQPDEPVKQRPTAPVLEKHLLDQLSTEEQDSLNKKYEEAKDAERKVEELEKEILEAKQKVQFYHAKMQEIILYKSRCDNRLNEISAKISGEKREAEALAKKYEEKYRQSGDVASKLTIEEATFRDIQEKKMELYRAIVKLEQGNADGIQDRANQIQSDLEELVKALNERCKTYGLRGKPTSLVELPFGWQAGIQEGAADWDEDWDKFEDEGFTFVKELTLEVKNVVAPPKPKTALVREKPATFEASGSQKSPSNADKKSDIQNSVEKMPENEESNARNTELTRTPPDSPAGIKGTESPSKEFQDRFNVNGSMHAFDIYSEYGDTESVFAGEKGFDGQGWGKFDTHPDLDAAWDSNPGTSKEFDRERHNENPLFGFDDFGLNPIRTGATKQGPVFDSVPSTPIYNSATSPHADNLFQVKSPFAFDSVPSTPLYNSIPGPSAFADSVPSTPMYNSTPRRFSEGSEEHYSFDSSSRFDMNDGGPFSSRESFSRFDSMRSTRDSDFDQGYAPKDSFARFDSFRSTADSDYNFGSSFPAPNSLARFDSFRSAAESEYGHGFPSFDAVADPFGSSEPFRSSHEAQTPRQDSDTWRAF